MNILHCPYNIGGQATTISRAQRKLGHRSDVMVFTEGFMENEYDYNLQLQMDSGREGIKRVLDFFEYAKETYDIFHFYSGSTIIGGSFTPEYIDLPILKSLGKKIIFIYVGYDAMQKRGLMKYPINPARECSQMYRYEKDEGIKRKVEELSKYADASFAHPYLAEFVPGAIYDVPYRCVNLEEWPYIGVDKRSNKIKIVHGPTNRAVKGTRYVIDAVDRLKNEGYNLELILVEGTPNRKAKELYKEADIVVDQLLVGWYGMFAIEAMALGKPVLVYLREGLVEMAPYSQKCPVVNTHPFNIIENLKMLIEDQGLRVELGKRGRKYVEEVHDSMKIAKWLSNFYETL